MPDPACAVLTPENTHIPAMAILSHREGGRGAGWECHQTGRDDWVGDGGEEMNRSVLTSDTKAAGFSVFRCFPGIFLQRRQARHICRIRNQNEFQPRRGGIVIDSGRCRS